MRLSDSSLYDVLSVLIAIALAGYGLWGLLSWLRRTRPELDIARPVAIGFAARFFAAAALSALSIGQTLRGGDELTFLGRSRDLVDQPLSGSENVEALTSELHTFLFSIAARIFEPDAPDMFLRVGMIAASVAGLLLLATAVHDLAGPRAARIAAWIIALEPAHVFFSSLLHKEPLMFLAEGMVAFGGAVLWKRGGVGALVPIVLGCLIAIATRPYAGWFLAAAGTVIVLHAAITRQQGVRAIALSGVAVALIIAFFPTVWNASSDESLEQLQASQDANASDDANLSLERVDYSTREKLITNLPLRIRDVIFKPYPWQTQNTSQRLGVIGTFIVLSTLVLLVLAIARNGGAVMTRAGPLVYSALFMLVAYSLSAGNAGTAYRYRTHVVALAISLVVVLLTHRREEREAAAHASSQEWPSLGTAPTLAR